MNSNISIGIAVRAARLERGMTQVELARRAGLVQSAVSRLEKGARGIHVSTLIRIAVALGMSIELV